VTQLGIVLVDRNLGHFWALISMTNYDITIYNQLNRSCCRLRCLCEQTVKQGCCNSRTARSAASFGLLGETVPCVRGARCRYTLTNLKELGSDLESGSGH
jgi:hypothetical protein